MSSTFFAQPRQSLASLIFFFVEDGPPVGDLDKFKKSASAGAIAARLLFWDPPKQRNVRVKRYRASHDECETTFTFPHKVPNENGSLLS